jgi:hypothetical protein
MKCGRRVEEVAETILGPFSENWGRRDSRLCERTVRCPPERLGSHDGARSATRPPIAGLSLSQLGREQADHFRHTPRLRNAATRVLGHLGIEKLGDLA